MPPNWTFILVVIFCSLRQVGDERQQMECTKKNMFQGDPGDQLTLISNVDRLERCHFVSTDSSGSQCCYHKNGFEKDCDTSTKSRVRDKAQCLEENDTFVMKLDWDTGTCKMTILKLSDAATGQYKSYNADDEPLDEDGSGCAVMVTGTGLSSEEIAGVVFAVIVVVFLVFIVINRNLKIITHENNNKGGGWVFKNPFSKSAATEQPQQSELQALHE